MIIDQESTLKRIHAAQSDPGCRKLEFTEGFVLGTLFGNYIKNVQGYDTSVEYKLKFDKDYRGDAFIAVHKYDEILDPKAEKINGGVLYKNVDISPEHPLWLTVRTTSNDLDDAPIQGPLSNKIEDDEKDYQNNGTSNYSPSIAETKLLDHLNIESFSGFGIDKMSRILEWMRNNFEFGRGESTTDGIISQKVGSCVELAPLFANLVYASGGISRIRTGSVVKLLVDGVPAYKMDLDYGPHAWTEIYYDGRWHVVDPTLYMTSDESAKSRAIDRMKKIYIRPYIAPTITFGNRKVDIPTDPIQRKSKTAEMIRKAMGYKTNYEHHGNIDVSSIRNVKW